MKIEEQRKRRVLGTRRLRLGNQLFKKRPVVNHGLSQVFSASQPSRLTKRALVRNPVILKNQWMIHGNIRRPLLEIAYRIAASGHHVAQQLVGVRYGASRAVNEPR